MIISRGRAYIFVHAPKTGGTSLALALEARAMADDILIGDTPKAKRRRGRVNALRTKARGRLWKHSTLADIDGVLSLDDLDAFKFFTLVRNPWDRAVSYYHWLQGQRFGHPAVQLAQRLAFSDFMLHPTVTTGFRENPARTYVTDATGTERPAHFMRLEHLAEDLAPLEAHLGFSLDEIPRVNTSSRVADYRAVHDAQTKAAVEDCCAEDIERFGYHF